MKTSWTGFGLESLVAPGLASLENPCFPELSKLEQRARQWTAEFTAKFVCHALLAHHEAARNVFVPLLHRTSLAIEEHEALRLSLPAAIKARAESPLRYLRVLRHAERVVTETRRAVECVRMLESDAGIPESWYGSPGVQALCDLDNAVKHLAGRVSQLPQIKPKHERNVFARLWLTNSGFRGVGVNGELAFAELAAILNRIADRVEFVLAGPPPSMPVDKSPTTTS